ncbi:hypothetical protein [Halopelagius fulvigenes]|uniref:Uncharacterized protein n=1 Tax=Halopelagius fulvigenes TaxID=1198324 RepID=A0ABD5U2I0_9EURY
MTHVFTYPWTVLAREPSTAIDTLAEAGVDGITVASYYHSVQTLDPQSPESLFERFPGGCYFAPDSEKFAETSIDPPTNEVYGENDAVRSLVDMATERDLVVGAWTVCMHNTRLGTANDQFRIQSAFGDSHDHALCPSYPEVQAYLAAVVKSLADRGVSRIDLESLGFPDVLHGHGQQFGHSKNHAISSPTGRVLLSQCGCEGCRTAAAEHPVDFKAAMAEVRRLCRESLAAPDDPHPSFEALTEEMDHLADLISFRTSVITDLVDQLAAVSGSVSLNYLVSDGLGHGPTDGVPAGVDLSRLSGLDSVTALCYTSDTAIGRDCVETLRHSFDGQIHAAVTLDPDVTPTQKQFERTVAAVQEVTPGSLFVYNHALMTEAHLSWLAGV